MDDWENFCGSKFIILENTVLGKCFRQLSLICPIYALFAIVCVYYIGRRDGWYLRGSHQLWIINARIILSIVLIECCIVRYLLLKLLAHIHLYYIDYLHISMAIFCWSVHIVYLYFLKTRVAPHSRGPILVVLCWVLTLAVTILDLRASVIYKNNSTPVQVIIEKYTIGIAVGLNVLYGLTLLFSSNAETSTYEGFISINHEEVAPLLTGGGVRYSGFHEERDPHTLGVAAENSGILSKLTFFWVRKILSKGSKNLLKSTDDLYDLPLKLKTDYIQAKVSTFMQTVTWKEISEQSFVSNNTTEHQNTLLRVLHKCFAIEYYLLGFLKLFSDVLSFCGPLLLNYLIRFLEEDKQPTVNGIYYAAGLFGVTFINAFFSAQFSFLVNCVGLKIRAALVTSVYHKTLSVNSSTLSRFSSGEIVNFMSTDVDRIVNFCQSFHEFWSLPFQVAISFYLLYKQVKMAFLAGVIFAVLLIPVNQKIANKIGQLSTSMMDKKDKRIKLMNELLTGIRVVKLHSWEDIFSSKVKDLRKDELKYLKYRKYLDAFCVYLWATTPVVIAMLTFVTYTTFMKERLTAAKVFTSLALFNMLITPLNAFPWVVNGLMEAWISLHRLQRFMQLPNFKQEQYYFGLQDQKNEIEICDGSFTWTLLPFCRELQISHEHFTDYNTYVNVTENFLLEDINLNIEKGQLIGIVGRVGSGKSMLISSIIGDLMQLQGTIALTEEDYENGIGIVLQESWVQQTTIQKNILFGKSFNFTKYKNVLEMCALLHDLEVFPAGDETEVGDRGVTLSGGQRARIALARAVYQDFDLYLLDDPLSAVDVHVAEHIFTNCIKKFLKNKTRLLCTHQVQFLAQADYIIVMENGKIIRQGTPEVVLQSNQMKSLLEKELQLDSVAYKISELKPVSNKNTPEEVIDDGQLIQEEEICEGTVKFKVYKSYWKAIGNCLSFSVLLSLFIMQASRTLSEWWLSVWVSCDSPNERNRSAFDSTVLGKLWPDRLNVTFSPEKGICVTGKSDEENLKFYLGVYGSLAVGNSIFTLIRAFLYAYCGVCAAITIHSKLLKSILKAPISFFDATPLGRILNRFSTDVYAIDDSLPFILNILLAQLFSLIASLTITCYGLTYIILLLVPLAALYYFIQGYYRCTSRQLKRLSSVSLSPIYAHLSETLNGHTTIRTFKASSRFCCENVEKLDKNQQARFATLAVSQWLNLRLQLIGVAIITGVAFLGVLEHTISIVDPGLVGLALSYALSITSLLSGVIMFFTETEKEMVSVERAVQYIEGISPENDNKVMQPPFAWPTHGVISFNNVSLQYRQNLPYALQNITFETRPGEKLGVVGRTGSGKSSLFQVLFRMVDIKSGDICIDGVNIKCLSLKELRSHLAVIPQDPFLFSGSVKENIDPEESYSDLEVWRTLRQCHLEDEVKRMGGLYVDIGEKGQLFSSGQKQLVCLARALLSKTKILCLDEATASVDYETDVLIQQTIRSAFKHTTILTIAHRIETILDSDRVIVMKNGEIVEFNKPGDLLQDTNSCFSQLLHTSKS